MRTTRMAASCGTTPWYTILGTPMRVWNLLWVNYVALLLQLTSVNSR